MNPLKIDENQDVNQDLSEDTFIPLTTESPQDPDDVVQAETYPDTPTDPELEGVPIPEGTSGYEPSPSDLPETVPSDPLLSLTTPQPDSQDGPEATAEEAYTALPEDQDGSAGPSDVPPPQPDTNPSPEVPASEAPQTNGADSSGPEEQLDSSKSPSVSETTTPGSSATSQPPDQISPSSEPQTNPSPAENTLDLQPEGQGEPQLEAQNVDTLSNDTESSPSNRENIGNLATTPASTPASTGPTKSSSSPVGSDSSTASPGSTTPSKTSPSDQESSKDDSTTTTSAPSEPQDTKENSSSPVPENGPKPSSEPEGDASNSVDDTGARDEPPKIPLTPAQEKDDVALEETTTDPMRLNSAPTNPSPTKATLAKTTSKPKPKPTKPSGATDPADALGKDNPTDYQADDSNNTDLCSGRPANAVTTLKNGTVIVFRGHYFWTLDNYRNPGPARGITDVWGVPSPIDTVYTRCNCQGKTYIFKGAQYWRFDNGEVDSGYPKLIETGFDGLRGQITAALSVPENRRRGESVYFFKRGGLVQKYSYKHGTSPTCGRKIHYPLFSIQNRVARQAVSPLGTAISISVSWRGFPSTVTSAVSIPNRRKPEGYNYYVFSRSKYYSVKMEADRPVLETPMSTSPKKNSAKSFFNCPKTV